MNSCFFKSFSRQGYKRALIQITERCNLHCAHCFVSATKAGIDLSINDIENKVIKILSKLKVESITITGGEPLCHPDFINIIKLFSKHYKKVTVCTNGCFLTPEILKELKKQNVGVNISIDGFTEYSHSKFRGEKELLGKTKESIEKAGKFNVLKGLLVTPNSLGKYKEYKDLCEFAIKNEAKYVLMNPLSSYGRGEKSINKLAKNNTEMNSIFNATKKYDAYIDMVYIRFPNEKGIPLNECHAKDILYLFANGDLSLCPYLVFAARTNASQYKEEDFIIGNIHENDSNYLYELYYNVNFLKLYNPGKNEKCPTCQLNNECGKGCPASVINAGKNINSTDSHLCPNIES